ncbi:MAG: RimK family alpha-L-glutamate ligase [Ignisphaera sp.]|nr:RimK family alpha-L-glutamate ligase [Ignisphaera sp.]MCX8168250.1 RimK family alpha-L-glutamate ligase [Ignisphaera sp.]MDW8084882.1 RimK family alpha-L-glutamate ligase [Ignisphaera sp.]
MLIGILTRNPNGWASSRLAKAIELLGHRALPFRFRDIVAHINGGLFKAIVDGLDIVKEISAIIVRPIGRCSLEWAIFRMDLLYALQDYGVTIVNKPQAIERCVDKFRALHLLQLHGIPVPETIVTENASLAYRHLNHLKSREVVVKPIFGSRGHGSTKIVLSDRDVLWEVFHAMAFTRHVLYVQKFLRHGGMDIRTLVVGERVAASMYRVAPKGMWKTNVSQGGQPLPIERLSPEIEDMAIKSAKAVECDVAGVDIAVADGKPYVLEINSQPGWRGLQTITDKDIALEIARYVIEKAKK